MGRKRYLLSLIIVGLAMLMNIAPSGCTSKEIEKLRVVTSTSLLAQIVERVGGENVDVVNIIPPAQCPGHFDVKPGDIQKLAGVRNAENKKIFDIYCNKLQLHKIA